MGKYIQAYLEMELKKKIDSGVSVQEALEKCKAMTTNAEYLKQYPMQQAAPNNTGLFGLFGSGSWLPPATIVRWDAATCSTVPVTQAWVDEVCGKLMALQTPHVEVKNSATDRMWAAHKQFVS
jgi:hypothetical protein